MEKQFLITESQLKTLLSSAKEATIFVEEMTLDGENTLDVYVNDAPIYSLGQGTEFAD